MQPDPEKPQSALVPAGRDRFAAVRGNGIGGIAFKAVPAEFGGALALEMTAQRPGGPARHLHHAQDEWFYCLEGSFLLEIGGETIRLSPGDSALGPREVPHAWAFLGPGIGRLLIVFNPAGQMEAFFAELARNDSMPPQEPAIWRAHGMELAGPPLAIR